MQLVSFIIVNWNGAAYLCNCLQSIREQTYGNFELIVVDNGSTDRSRDLLLDFPEAKIIVNETNLGFGRANNQGLAIASGQLIAFVNNDTVLDPNWLQEIMRPLDRPEIGMCAGKTLSYFQPDRIDNTGHLLFWDGVNRGRGRMQKDEGQFDGKGHALFPSGCAALFRTDVLRQVGYFDEDFFLYGDDAELGIRVCLAGWECAFVPSAIAYHRYSASLSAYHPQKFFFVERNRFWLALKYFPLELIILNPLFSLFRYLFHFVALITKKGVSHGFTRTEPGWKLFVILLTAQWAAWRRAPHFWKKRREFLSRFSGNRKRFYHYFLQNRIGVKELTFTA